MPRELKLGISYKVIASYEPQEDRCIECETNDVIFVQRPFVFDFQGTEHEPEGWLYGTNTRTGAKGCVPAAYVKYMQTTLRDAAGVPADLPLTSQKEKLHLSDVVSVFPDQKQGNFFKGEISSFLDPRPCAVKISSSQQNSESFDEIMRETEILRNLSIHAHIIFPIHSGIAIMDGIEHAYIAFEKCHKFNLSQYFSEIQTDHDASLGLNFSKQLINGIAYIHGKLIIHKKLAPVSIFLSSDLSSVKIAEFGSSQMVESNFATVYCEDMFGVPGYRPPEGFGRSHISLETDNFSLGALIYFLLSNGKSAFGTQPNLWDHNTKQGAIVDLFELRVSNPLTTTHLIKSMLSRDRRSRPTIQQIENHPCWTGQEHDCDFDYERAKDLDNLTANLSIHGPEEEASDRTQTSNTKESESNLLVRNDEGSHDDQTPHSSVMAKSRREDVQQTSELSQSSSRAKSRQTSPEQPTLHEFTSIQEEEIDPEVAIDEALEDSEPLCPQTTDRSGQSSQNVEESLQSPCSVDTSPIVRIPVQNLATDLVRSRMEHSRQTLLVPRIVRAFSTPQEDQTDSEDLNEDVWKATDPLQPHSRPTSPAERVASNFSITQQRYQIGAAGHSASVGESPGVHSDILHEDYFEVKNQIFHDEEKLLIYCLVWIDDTDHSTEFKYHSKSCPIEFDANPSDTVHFTLSTNPEHPYHLKKEINIKQSFKLSYFKRKKRKFFQYRINPRPDNIEHKYIDVDYHVWVGSQQKQGLYIRFNNLVKHDHIGHVCKQCQEMTLSKSPGGANYNFNINHDSSSKGTGTIVESGGNYIQTSNDCQTFNSSTSK